jgi:hypothetical protein
MEPQVCLGLTLEYTDANGVTTAVKFNMDPYIQMVLARVEMQDCYPRDAPLLVNFTLFKSDKPVDAAAEQLAIDKFNKLFRHQVSNCKELTHQY